MNRKGTSLMEAVIAIFIISVALLTFLESLNVAMTGTLQLNRKTSALNLAKSQIEYVKAQTYNVSVGNISDVYGLITTGENISDRVNYTISGRVDNVSIAQPLQQIAVNVSYLQGKQVQITGYKTSDGTLSEPASRGLIVTDNLIGVPTLTQGYSWFCSYAFKGYYHVFTTGTTGPISLSVKFGWSRASSGSSLGAPMIAIYTGTPVWVNRDSQGDVREDGVIERPQANWPLGSIGDLPGPGTAGATGSTWMCECYEFFGCEPNCSGELDPIAWAPHHCPPGIGWFACWLGGLGFTGPYPCCGACYTGDVFWTYDTALAFPQSGYVENTIVTGNVSPGTYTALLFNAENRINIDSISAAITYYK